MIFADGDRLKLEGRVTVATVPELLAEGEKLIAAGACVVDFAGVSDIDSAAVALALHWQRTASLNNTRLELLNLPAAMSNLAILYGVQDLIASA